MTISTASTPEITGFVGAKRLQNPVHRFVMWSPCLPPRPNLRL